MKNVTLALLGLFLTFLALPLSARQTPGCQSYKLTAFDAGTAAVNSYYGFSLDVQGDCAVVGDFFEGPTGQIARGAIYLYERSGQNWFLEQKIPYAGAGVSPFLGFHVRMRDGVVVAGAPSDDDTVPGSGSAFVYELQGGSWQLTQRLLPSVQSTFQEFGERVDTDGNTVVVGAGGDDTAGSSAGAIFVFDRQGPVWTESAQLVASDASTSQFFGDVFALDGNWILAAVDGDDQIAQDAGAVYVFDGSSGTWIESDKLFASDAAFLTNFGKDVDVRGSRAVVASALAAYVFEEAAGQWTEEVRLVPLSGGTVWGVNAVSLDGDAIVVGATDGATEAVFVFQKLGEIWVQIDVLVGLDTSSGDRFGRAVALDGDTLWAGAEDGDAPGFSDAGAAYVFSIFSALCPTLNVSDPTVSLSSGGTQVLFLNAGPALADTFFVLLGSASGSDPGFAFQSLRIPLLVDDYTLQTLTPGPTNPLQGNAGKLNGGGSAQVTFTVPPFSDPSLIGLRLFHSFVAYSTNPLSALHASNFAEVTLID